MTRRFVGSPRGQLHIVEHGSGAPVVLLHETAASAKAYGRVLPILGSRLRAISLDTPGFGESYRPTTSPGLAGYARAVIDLLDGLGIERASLLGGLTGAAIAVECSASFPDRVERLVLANCPDFSPHTREKLIESQRPGTLQPDGSHLFEAWRMFASSERTKLLGLEWAEEQLLDRMVASPNYHWAYLAAFEQTLREVAERVPAPTLIVTGDRSRFAYKQAVLARFFADGSAVILPDADPLPFLDQPERFCEVVLPFLLDGTRPPTSD